MVGAGAVTVACWTCEWRWNATYSGQSDDHVVTASSAMFRRVMHFFPLSGHHKSRSHAINIPTITFAWNSHPLPFQMSFSSLPSPFSSCRVPPLVFSPRVQHIAFFPPVFLSCLVFFLIFLSSLILLHHSIGLYLPLLFLFTLHLLSDFFFLNHML